MAQITEIKIICDEHLRQNGEQVEGTEYQLGRIKFALCDNCYADLYKPLEGLLEHLTKPKGGRGAKSASKASSPPAQDETCEECGDKFSGKDYKRPKQALNMHIRNKHAA